ncbi:MAG: translation initiation factor IF-2 subunit alpha [Thermoprotei archaeon]|nr:MAG: translation initiation factor IF-2 subunit alpha [Thermoprotei archaeon]
MVRKRRKLPARNELVIGTVKKIFEHGAFITLDEYGGIEAYCPLNEVSHSWFHHIREVLKEGQKRVFKVIRVNPVKMHIDVSLKRVSDAEKKDKIYEWKRAQRAEKLLEIAAKKLGKTLDDAYREAGWKMEDYFGEIYAGFEEAVLRGKKALTEAGLREPWLSIIYELAQAYVEIRKAKISGEFIVRCYERDGVERIKKVLTSWRDVLDKYRDVEVRMYTEGAPRYRVDLTALDYKTAESLLKDILSRVREEAVKQNCIIEFKRVKK